MKVDLLCRHWTILSMTKRIFSQKWLFHPENPFFIFRKIILLTNFSCSCSCSWDRKKSNRPYRARNHFFRHKDLHYSMNVCSLKTPVKVKTMSVADSWTWNVTIAIKNFLSIELTTLSDICRDRTLPFLIYFNKFSSNFSRLNQRIHLHTFADYPIRTKNWRQYTTPKKNFSFKKMKSDEVPRTPIDTLH